MSDDQRRRGRTDVNLVRDTGSPCMEKVNMPVIVVFLIAKSLRRFASCPILMSGHYNTNDSVLARHFSTFGCLLCLCTLSQTSMLAPQKALYSLQPAGCPRQLKERSASSPISSSIHQQNVSMRGAR
jgi:hypothetical protein